MSCQCDVSQPIPPICRHRDLVQGWMCCHPWGIYPMFLTEAEASLWARLHLPGPFVCVTFPDHVAVFTREQASALLEVVA